MEVDDTHFSSLFDKLDRDREDEKVYCDVTVSVNNVLFPAHRCILGTFCVYFATLFQSSFKDKFNETIKLSGPIGEEIKPSTFQSILNYCYKKKSTLTSTNVYDVLAAAEFLQIDGLKAECIKHLKTLISAESWLKIYRTAAKWNYTSLLESCMDSFLTVKNELDMKEFTHEEVHLVVRHGREMMTAEETYEMILGWIDGLPNDKKQHSFDELAKELNFERMDASYVGYIVVTNDFVMNSHVVLQRLVKQRLGIRKGDEKLLLLGGDGAHHSVQKYVQDAWHKCADAPLPIVQSAVASNNSYVFVAGGRKQRGSIQVYDIRKDAWSVLENILKTPRSGATACIINKKLYLFAGYDGCQYLSSAEVLTINGSSCVQCDDHRVPNLAVARVGHASVTKDNRIYFFGGEANYKKMKSCESIDVVSHEASKLPSLNHERWAPSAVVFDNNIIVMGGIADKHKTVSSVEAYSFITDQWTIMPSMTAPRNGHSAIVYRGQILVVGGYDNQKNCHVRSIEIFADKQWKINSTLTSPRSEASVLKFV